MSQYRPVHKQTGQVGPPFEFLTLAVFWISGQADSLQWTWEVLPDEPKTTSTDEQKPDEHSSGST